MPVTFIPDGTGGVGTLPALGKQPLQFIPDSTSAPSLVQQLNNTPSSPPMLPVNSIVQDILGSLKAGFTQPLPGVEQMNPGVAKTLAEQVNVPNAVLAATGAPVIGAFAKLPLLAKTLVSGLLAQAGVQGLQSGTQEAQAGAALSPEIAKEKEFGLGDAVQGAQGLNGGRSTGQPMQSRLQQLEGEQAGHFTQAGLDLASLLPAFAGKALNAVPEVPDIQLRLADPALAKFDKERADLEQAHKRLQLPEKTVSPIDFRADEVQQEFNARANEAKGQPYRVGPQGGAQTLTPEQANAFVRNIPIEAQQNPSRLLQQPGQISLADLIDSVKAKQAAFEPQRQLQEPPKVTDVEAQRAQAEFDARANAAKGDAYRAGPGGGQETLTSQQQNAMVPDLNQPHATVIPQRPQITQKAGPEGRPDGPRVTVEPYQPPQPKQLPEPAAKFIGTQPGFKNIPPTDLFNLTRPIVDAHGNVLHSVGSTVSRSTLEKYGVPIPEKGGDITNAKDVRSNPGQSFTQGVQQEGSTEARGNDIQQTPQEGATASGTEQPVMKLHSGVGSPEDWEDIKKKLGVEGGFMHHAAKVAYFDSGAKSPQTPMDAGQLKNRVVNKLGGESREAKMWKDLGIDERFKAGEKATPEEMAKWMVENGPRVEVRKFSGPTPVDQQETATRLAQLHHQLDTEFPNWRQGRQGGYRVQTDEERGLLRQIHELETQQEFGIPAANQSHWQSIAPKAERDMPGYVEIAVVKPLAKKGDKVYDEAERRMTYEHQNPPGQQFPSSHNFPPNTLGFVRGYMETDPTSGEKTFHVIEVQSDWAQKVRDDEKVNNTRGMNPNFKGRQTSNDPLLKDYERLALKAAIDHARSEGATKIAVSDAETAMMTEGHDRMLHDNMRSFRTKQEAEAYAKTIGGEPVVSQNNNELAGEPESWGVFVARPTQEPGMRLHYNRTLPKITEELTGSKGEKVSLGEHKNAYEGSRPEERVGDDGTLESGKAYAWDEYKKHSNLIFRNPDGTPKTSITARSFPLSQIASRIATGEPFSPMNKLYSGVPIPKEALDALTKVKDEISKGKFPLVSSLPDKPPRTNPEAPTKLEESLAKTTDTLPIQTRDVSRPQPGEKESTLQMLGREVNQKLNAASKIDKVLMPVDAIFDRMDGNRGEYNGWLFKNVRQPIDESFNYELGLRDNLLNPVTALVEKHNLNEQSGERIGVYAHDHQPGGRQRLIESGITEETIKKINSTITKPELEVYNTMRAFMEQTLPAVQSVMKEVYGQEVKPVENYFPMPRDYQVYKPDPTELAKGEFDDHATWKLLSGDFEPRGAKSEQGFTITRKPNAKTAIKINAFEIYQQHIRDVAHLVAMQKQLVDIAKTVRRPLFAEKYGDSGQEMVLDWLNTVARQGKGGKQIAWLDAIRNRTSKSIIGFRLASQIVHSANVPLAMERAGIYNWNRGLNESLSDRGQKFLNDHFKETFERGGGEPSLVDVSKGNAGRWVFGIQRQIDRLNTQATVLGVYMKELKAKGKNPLAYDTLAYDRDAAAKAMVLARRAVASPIYKDIPPALARGGSLGKMFFQFQNTFLDQWSNIRHDFVSAGIMKVNPELAVRMGIALAAMMMIESGIKTGIQRGVNAATGKKEKDDLEESYTKRLETDAIRRVPGAGQIMSEVLYGETGIPTLDVAVDALKGGIETATGKRIQGYPNAKPSNKVREQGALKAAVSAAELAGIPGTSQGGDILKNLLDEAQAGDGKPVRGKRKPRYTIIK